MAAWTQNKSGTLKIDKEAIEHPSKTFPENTSKGVFKASIPRCNRRKASYAAKKCRGRYFQSRVLSPCSKTSQLKLAGFGWPAVNEKDKMSEAFLSRFFGCRATEAPCGSRPKQRASASRWAKSGASAAIWDCCWMPMRMVFLNLVIGKVVMSKISQKVESHDSHDSHETTKKLVSIRGK